jgi:hypothetical protein
VGELRGRLEESKMIWSASVSVHVCICERLLSGLSGRVRSGGGATHVLIQVGFPSAQTPTSTALSGY